MDTKVFIGLHNSKLPSFYRNLRFSLYEVNNQPGLRHMAIQCLLGWCQPFYCPTEVETVVSWCDITLAWSNMQLSCLVSPYLVSATVILSNIKSIRSLGKICGWIALNTPKNRKKQDPNRAGSGFQDGHRYCAAWIVKHRLLPPPCCRQARKGSWKANNCLVLWSKTTLSPHFLMCNVRVIGLRLATSKETLAFFGIGASHRLEF